MQYWFYVDSTGQVIGSGHTLEDLELPPRFDLESDEGELPGLETPSPLELLDLVPFFFKKFLIVAPCCGAKATLLQC